MSDTPIYDTLSAMFEPPHDGRELSSPPSGLRRLRAAEQAGVPPSGIGTWARHARRYPA